MRLGVHDRRDGVEERQLGLAGQRARIAAARAGRGEGAGGDDHARPSQAAAGRRPRRARCGCAGAPRGARVTASAKPSRSTASAPPAGVWCASAAGHDQRAQPGASRRAAGPRRWPPSRRRGTSWSTPARRGGRSGGRRCRACGRISCSTTWAPASAACQAASEPASPPPMMWIASRVIAASYAAPSAGGSGARDELGYSTRGCAPGAAREEGRWRVLRSPRRRSPA